MSHADPAFIRSDLIAPSLWHSKHQAAYETIMFALNTKRARDDDFEDVSVLHESKVCNIDLDRAWNNPHSYM